MLPKVKLIALDINNPDHIVLMYKVRTHPEVDKFLSGKPPQNFLEHVKYLYGVGTSKRFYVIAANNVLCGYCQLTPRQDNTETGWCLHPDWWGKKIGSQAVEQLVDIVKQDPILKHKPVMLVVKTDNPRAVKLYKNHGFVITKENAAESEYIMELTTAHD